MKTITIFNFLASSSAAPLVAKVKGYVVCLFVLALFLGGTNANAQNGTYTLAHLAGTSVASEITTTNLQSPFMSGRANQKIQYLYRASELRALPNNAPEGTGGKIMALYFDVTQVPGGVGVGFTLKNYTVKLGNTTLNNLTDQNFGIGFPYAGAVTTYVGNLTITQLGWARIDIPAGFEWDGTSNIIVEICKSNPDGDVTWNAHNYSVKSATFNQGASDDRDMVRAFNTKNNASPSAGHSGCTYNHTLVTSIADQNANNVMPATSTVTPRRIRPNIKFEFACEDAPVAAGSTLPVEILGSGGCMVYTLDVVNETTAHGLSYQWRRSSTIDFSSYDVIGTTERIVVSQTTSGKYYQRRTMCGGSGNYSAPYFVNAASQNTYNGVTGTWTAGEPDESSTRTLVFNGGNKTMSQNARGCGCYLLNSAQVVVPSGVTLQVDGFIRNDQGGKLEFLEGSSLIQKEKDASNVGPIVYRRASQPMVPYDFTYWSSPVKLQVLENFSPNTWFDKFLSWDINTQNWFVENKTNTMTAGKGYIIRAPQNQVAGTPYNGRFEGVPNNGDITVPFALGTDKLNLIGNPYPSPINAAALVAANSSKMDGTFYFWTHNTPVTGQSYSANDYAVMNALGGTQSSPTAQQPDGHIGAGQSVFVNAKPGSAPGTGSILFTNDIRRRAADNTVFFKAAGNVIVDASATEQRHRLWLNLTNNSGFKQILVGYVAGATDGYDEGFDGKAMAGPVISFYSVLNQEKMAIQGRPLPFNVHDQVPLGFSTSTAGAHKIEIASYDGLFVGENIYLEDKLLNVVHDLKAGPYSFTSAAGTFNERFVLNYVGSSLQTASLAGNQSTIGNGIDFVAYKQSSDLHIDGGNTQIESVKVFDLSGRLLGEQRGESGQQLIFSNPSWSSQVLIVQLHTADKIILTKKVVF